MRFRKPTVCGSVALPVVWLGAAAVFTLMQPPGGPAPLSEQPHVTTYLVERHGPVMSVAAVSLIFAALYGVMVLTRAHVRPRLAWIQSAVLITGLALVLAPSAFLRSGSPSAAVADPAGLQIWNVISTAGLVLALVGLGLFAMLVLDLVLRRFRSRPAAA